MRGLKNSLLLLPFVVASLSAQGLPPLDGVVERVSQQRLIERIEALSAIGREGLRGVTRPSFSDADLEARDLIRRYMLEAGLDVRVDAAANIIGRREGSEPGLPPILFGSHIDSVPNGGKLDGVLGVLGAIEVSEALRESQHKTRHPLEVIVFTDEERTMVGSRALGGQVDPEILQERTGSGLTLTEGLLKLSGNPDALAAAALAPGQAKAFVELHIEQGGVLEGAGKTIGIVQGIVGIRWWEVTVEGVANHAGTTPMKGRHDALVAAAQFVLTVRDVALQTPGTQVATVGQIHAYPGAPNVVPGRVEASLEIRDLSAEKIDDLFEKIRTQAIQIGQETGTRFHFKALDADAKVAKTDPRLRDLIQASADRQGLSFLRLPSGAGHDAQNMAARVPIGMIFIPSIGGISHSPEEASTAEDIKHGVAVLAETLLRLDQEEW